jgi:acetyl esterase/lipase
MDRSDGTTAGHWGQLTQSERDAAYNNSLAVPEGAAIQKARAEASAVFRTTRTAHLDVPYGNGPRNKWDLFPGPNPEAPCLVFIHGGYWQQGGRDTCSVVAGGVTAHGWSAACVGYTLAPDAMLSDIVVELNAALDWLRDHRAAYRMSSGPLIVAGNSAGGHLTALMLSHTAVSAALAISGIFELGPIRDTYLNEKLRLREAEIASLSPMHLPPVLKPMAIAYGSAELPTLIEESRRFHAYRAGHHAPGALVPVPHANHFNILLELQQADGLLTRHLLELERYVTRKSPQS